jgi:hypothetical protein
LNACKGLPLEVVCPSLEFIHELSILDDLDVIYLGLIVI